MFNGRMKIAFLVVLLGCLLSACAQIKEAGRTVGHTTRDVTREIGHGTRDAAKAVGEGVKKVAKSATEDDKQSLRNRLAVRDPLHARKIQDRPALSAHGGCFRLQGLNLTLAYFRSAVALLERRKDSLRQLGT